jgi:excisionase family DNA binding protein
VARVTDVNEHATGSGVSWLPGAWQTRTVTNMFPERQWLTLSEIADALGVTQSRIRKMIEERQLLAVKRDGMLSVPADFLRDDEPLSELRGTLFVLADAGFRDDDAMQWLLSEEESLLVAPIDALRAGRKAEVRRVAQALA